MSITVTRLDPPIPVTIVAGSLPRGLQAAGNRHRAWAYAWIDTADGDTLWRCCLDATGEWLDVPNPEIRADENWTIGRRFDSLPP